MTHRSVQKLQLILQADLLKLGPCGRIHLRLFAAVAGVDIIHIAHQLKGLLLADVFKKGSAKIIGDIVFSVRKCTCAAKAVHNGTGFTFYAGFYFLAVDGAMPVL